mmetsp:Transcript_13408/g.33754  ORF Transcript_13408/g.33754 Transcript_13408/m.33754 type:complete len:438 (-) Transcript_13408:116-1429(-)|eukprot:CAMPEP_0116096234 /NCGR_PEP_ID=MMETSP0327-20121206/10077_1 /TAXON_ID=44447 /ORGANISM="Pseudo-nitzschia delicatissima, Strain B596" /LENGTH=437 /DNA_ID=CAMNT_0003587933 /DNA_START=224 /DNA_END=1537 /DNA_ORIENTATION=+
MQRYRLFFKKLLCLVIAVALTGGPSSSSRITKSSSSLFVAAQEYEWQECSTFLSPNMGSWAVYAARNYKADELVELTPFFIPLETHQSMYSVLDNYVFGFERSSTGASEVASDQHLNVVLLGNGGFYNHHDNPNLRYVQVVAREGDDVPHLVGFRATRDIAAGEQLYVSYVDDPTKKQEWFEKRGIVADTGTEEKIDPNMLPFYASKFCSKIYGGVGAPTWKDNILPILESLHENTGSGTILPPSSWMDLTRLAPFDAGLSDARAKVPIKKGGHIEKSLGLVLSRNSIRGTPLGPIAFYWENLKIDHHQHLINLRDDKKLVLQYQGPDTQWESVDRFQGYSEMTVLPVSGNIGMIRRVGSGEYNCKLMIRSNQDHGTNVGVTLELIATRDIAVGEVLKLNIAPSEFVEEYRMLHDEMEESGQPHHPGIFDPINDEEL